MLHGLLLYKSASVKGNRNNRLGEMSQKVETFWFGWKVKSKRLYFQRHVSKTCPFTCNTYPFPTGASQLARKSGPTSGRQRYDVTTSYRCRPDVGPTFLAGCACWTEKQTEDYKSCCRVKMAEKSTKCIGIYVQISNSGLLFGVNIYLHIPYRGSWNQGNFDEMSLWILLHACTWRLKKISKNKNSRKCV